MTTDTKRRYCDALLALCETQKLSKISVSALIKEAKTARQTFYNNFRDINDLVSYLPINYLLSDGLPLNTLENIRHAFVFAQYHKGFFCQLPDHLGQNNFRDTFKAWLQDSCYRQYLGPEISPDTRLRMKLQIDLYCAGIIDVFLDWCRHGMEWPIEALLDTVWDCAPGFVRATPLVGVQPPGH